MVLVAVLLAQFDLYELRTPMPLYLDALRARLVGLFLLRANPQPVDIAHHFTQCDG